MEDKLELNDFIKMFKNINITIQDNIKYLSELDSVIGDGDHGITIARGLKNAIEKIEEDNPENISDLLKKVGLTMISTMGGVSGPIFGSIFIGMATKSEGKESINLSTLYDMFFAALDKVKNLGKAKPGDKTMVDSLTPAVESIKKSVDNRLSIKEAFKSASIAAEKGAISTKEMIAKKGRSRYHAERSLGYQDAGATTLYLIINSMYETI